MMSLQSVRFLPPQFPTVTAGNQNGTKQKTVTEKLRELK